MGFYLLSTNLIPLNKTIGDKCLINCYNQLLMKNILQIKNYLLKANKFLWENKIFYVYAFVASFFTYLFSIHYPFDPDGLLIFIGILPSYLLFGFFVLLPIFLKQEQENKKLTILQIIKGIVKNTNSLIKLTLLAILFYLPIIFAFYLFFDLFLEIKIVEQAFIDTAKNHGFVFYPLGAIFWAVATFISAPFYFIQMIYFFEKKKIFFAFKKGFILSLKHLNLLIPLAIFESLYYALTVLFIPTGNYFFVPIHAFTDTLLYLMIFTIIFLFYKDNYQIDTVTKASLEAGTKKQNKVVRWIGVISFIILSQLSLLLFFVYIYSFLPTGTINNISPFVYILIALNALVLPLILKLSVRPVKVILSFLLISLIAFVSSIPLAASIPDKTQTEQTINTQTELSSKNLLEAINKKREENHVKPLEYEESTCALAKVVVTDVVDEGTNAFYSSAAFNRQIDRMFQENPSIDRDLAPEWYSEFLTYEVTVEESITVWKNDMPALFENKDYQYGCVAVKDGFGIVVVSGFYNSQKQQKEDINTPLDYKTSATLL